MQSLVRTSGSSTQSIAVTRQITSLHRELLIMSPGLILVAEDNRILQDVIRFNLAKAGYEVLTAVDGLQALELIGSHDVDLLVTDCQMPRMSGIELVMAIRASPRTQRMPVLFCTAKGFEIDEQKLQSLDLPQVVCKPFSPAELIRRVGGMLARKQERTPFEESEQSPGKDCTPDDGLAAESVQVVTNRLRSC